MLLILLLDGWNMTVVIGIDCAVARKNVGLARGVLRGTRVEMLDAITGRAVRDLGEEVAGWVRDADAALIALDAPLGWPDPMREELERHRAGMPIEAPPNAVFRRRTDDVVERRVRKRPLDVGADRIARTAHAALALLGQIRVLSGHPIPLGWSPGRLSSVQAIEVYPAATLASRGRRPIGYKKPEHIGARRDHLAALSDTLEVRDVDATVASADAFDAALCLVAAADFLSGDVVLPEDYEQASREGWIWTRERGP